MENSNEGKEKKAEPIEGETGDRWARLETDEQKSEEKEGKNQEAFPQGSYFIEEPQKTQGETEKAVGMAQEEPEAMEEEENEPGLENREDQSTQEPMPCTLGKQISSQKESILKSLTTEPSSIARNPFLPQLEEAIFLRALGDPVEQLQIEALALSAETSQLPLISSDSSPTRKDLKRLRRKANQILRCFNCPVASCNKAYG